MLAGHPPFPADERQRSAHALVVREILSGEPAPIPPSASAAASGVLRALLQRDEARRLASAGCVQSHDFFAGMSWSKLRAKAVPSPLLRHVSRESERHVSPPSADVGGFGTQTADGGGDDLDGACADADARPEGSATLDVFRYPSTLSLSPTLAALQLHDNGSGGSGATGDGARAPGSGPPQLELPVAACDAARDAGGDTWRDAGGDTWRVAVDTSDAPHVPAPATALEWSPITTWALPAGSPLATGALAAAPASARVSANISASISARVSPSSPLCSSRGEREDAAEAATLLPATATAHDWDSLAS